MKKLIPQRAKNSLVFGWFICTLAALFYTYEYLLRIEPGIMVHDLRVYFSLSAGGIGLLTSMYYWAYTPLQLFVGLITDFFGARRVLIAAIAACTIGTFAFGATHSAWMASGARFIVGFGSAFAFVGALKLGADWLPRSHFSLFVGLCTALGMLGAMFGETGMSWVVDHVGWHPVLVDSIWLGIVLIAIFALFVYEKHQVFGAEHRIESLDFPLLRNALFKVLACDTIVKAGFIGCSLFLSLSIFAEQWGNEYIQKVLLTTNAQAASYYVDMVFLGWFIGSPISGFLSEKLATRTRVLFWGCVLSLAAVLPVILCPRWLSHWSLAILLFLFGFFSSAQINCFAIARDLVSTRLTATAVGLMNAMVMVGGMIVQPLFAYCLNWLATPERSIHGRYVYVLSDYQHGLLIIPFFLVISAFVIWSMHDTYETGVSTQRRRRIRLRY